MRLPNRAFILTPRTCFVGWTEVNASSTTKNIYCLTLFSSASLGKRSFCVFLSLADYQRRPRDVSELHVITSCKQVARCTESKFAQLLSRTFTNRWSPNNVREKSIFKIIWNNTWMERCDEQLNPCCCGLFLHTHYFIPLQMSMDRRVMNSTLQWNGRIFYLPDTSFPFNSFIWWRVDFQRWVEGASAWLMVGHSRQSEKSENHLSLPRWDGPASCSVKHSPYKQRSKP